MLYNSGKNADGAGAASIRPASSWERNTRPQHSAIDPAYMENGPYHRVHLYQPEYRTTETSSQPVPSNSLAQIGPGHEYHDWAARLPETNSTISLFGPANALEDELLSSRFEAFNGDNNYDLSSLLRQERWHIPDFSAGAGSDGGLTEDVIDYMTPGPSSLTAHSHGIASAEARPSSEVLSVSDFDALNTALSTPVEGSSKKRKAQALDLESDTEGAPRIASGSPKKRKIRNYSPVPAADSEQRDVANGSSPMNAEKNAEKEMIKDKGRLEARAQSSQNLREKKSSAIAALRGRVFPGSVKPGTYMRRPRVADGEGDKDKIKETTELQVILRANDEIDEDREMIKALQNKVKELEDGMKTLKESHAQLGRENRHLRMLSIQSRATGWLME